MLAPVGKGSDVQDNPGHLPEDCEILDENGQNIGWKMVHVRLFNGWDSKAANSPPWPSNGSRAGPTVWKISRPKPHPFEIQKYEVI